MYTTKARSDRMMVIGNQGENLVRRLSFDISSWKEDYPDCNIFISYKPECRPEGYRVSNISFSEHGDILYWNITAEDTKYPGYGSLQVICNIPGGQLLKSPLFRTYINKSL